MGFEDWLREADEIVAEAEEESRRKMEANQRAREKELAYNKRRMAMDVRVTKCFLVQVVDDDENEIAAEYVFSNTKKEAQDRGYDMRDEIAKEEAYADTGES